MIKNIDIKLIDTNPSQPRKQFSGIKELAASIKKKGLLEPIMVRPKGDRFQIIYGERRFRAAQIAGLEKIAAEVRDCSDKEMFELAIVENMQRENLSPIEEAHSFQQMQNKGYTQDEIAKLVGRSQTQIAHRIRLLKLPEKIQEGISENKITDGHARQLLRLQNQAYQERLFDRIVTETLSVKVLHEEVNKAIIYIKRQQELAGDDTSDEELLTALGCGANESNYWLADDFSLCVNREIGIFARLLFLHTNRATIIKDEEHLLPMEDNFNDQMLCPGDSIAIYGFSDNVKRQFKEACNYMRRMTVEELENCSLVFVNFPARPGNIAEYVDDIVAKCSENIVIILRCGTECFEIPIKSAGVDCFKIIKVFLDRGFRHCSLYNVALEVPPYEQLMALEERALNNREIIDTFENWIVISRSPIMSRDIIEDDSLEEH